MPFLAPQIVVAAVVWKLDKALEMNLVQIILAALWLISSAYLVPAYVSVRQPSLPWKEEGLQPFTKLLQPTSCLLSTA